MHLFHTSLKQVLPRTLLYYILYVVLYELTYNNIYSIEKLLLEVKAFWLLYLAFVSIFRQRRWIITIAITMVIKYWIEMLTRTVNEMEIQSKHNKFFWVTVTKVCAGNYSHFFCVLWRDSVFFSFSLYFSIFTILGQQLSTFAVMLM